MAACAEIAMAAVNGSGIEGGEPVVDGERRRSRAEDGQSVRALRWSSRAPARAGRECWVAAVAGSREE